MRMNRQIALRQKGNIKRIDGTHAIQTRPVIKDDPVSRWHAGIGIRIQNHVGRRLDPQRPASRKSIQDVYDLLSLKKKVSFDVLNRRRSAQVRKRFEDVPIHDPCPDRLTIVG